VCASVHCRGTRETGAAQVDGPGVRQKVALPEGRQRGAVRGRSGCSGAADVRTPLCPHVKALTLCGERTSCNPDVHLGVEPCSVGRLEHET
jgi:hypothetical protein